MSRRRPGLDPRAAFFALAALACFLLAPVAGDEFQGVALGVGITYVLLAVASHLDARSRR